MTNFDFITAKDFRESLERDFDELERSAKAQCWKGVQVLAGSIVEALLVDYLASTANSRVGKDPLKIDLADAIKICREEGVLSDRVADLCSVIRSYRNLIHPGRMSRLGEAPPDEASASIATALVSLIVGEVAKFRRASVGLTAEQVVSKIVRDSNANHILAHLLQEVSETEKERLLTRVIPEELEKTFFTDGFFGDLSGRLSEAHRLVLESATPEIRKAAAAEFIRVLREEDGDHVSRYGAAFFRASDLAYAAPAQHAIVLDHLMSLVSPPSMQTHETLRMMQGIGKFLRKTDAKPWLDSMLRTMTQARVEPSLKKRIQDALSNEASETSDEVNKKIDERFPAWIEREKSKPDVQAMLQKVKQEMEDWRGIPF